MNRTSWTIIIITILASAIIIVCFLLPNISDFRKINMQNAAALEESRTSTEQIEILKNLKQNNQMPNLIKVATNYIPTDPETDQFKQTITTLAQNSGLQIDQFDLTALPSKTTSINELNFSLTTTGSISNLIAFIKNIDKSARLVSLNTIHITANVAQMTEVVSGSAYFKPEIAKDGPDSPTITQSVIDYFSKFTY